MHTYIEEAVRREEPEIFLLQELSRPGPERDRATNGEWTRIETRKQRGEEDAEGEAETAERSGYGQVSGAGHAIERGPASGPDSAGNVQGPASGASPANPARKRAWSKAKENRKEAKRRKQVDTWWYHTRGDAAVVISDEAFQTLCWSAAERNVVVAALGKGQSGGAVYIYVSPRTNKLRNTRGQRTIQRIYKSGHKIVVTSQGMD